MRCQSVNVRTSTDVLVNSQPAVPEAVLGRERFVLILFFSPLSGTDWGEDRAAF